MSGILVIVRNYYKSQRNVRGVSEFHNVWKVGTFILTFTHIVVAIPVLSMAQVNQNFVKSLKLISFKRLRY
jgi:hypothetical protein